ncbi:InlB B-repeat-containing protein [Faecalibacterium sp.]|uniref:InlB B-repeat-containing protein n=1 Tax=Faecalibacterium sp. TaxID=1971605 RepID=UPI003A9064A1
MKQGKLIRRAVSAALAGCMMFTFSAPALAESTDALMQLSTAAKSAVSVLDAENGDTANYGFTIDLNGTTKTVNESNCKDIFEDKKLSYDPITNKLTNNGTIGGKLTIDAPNVDVELTGNSSVIDGYSTNLNIKNARNVTLSTNSFSVVGGLYSGNVEINCSGKLTIKNSDFTWPAIKGDLTVHNALEILVEGRFSTVVGGDVKIECACPATFKNNQNGGIAKSITYAGDYVYYTSDATDAEAVDPNVTSIPAETAKYVRIAPKMRYNIYTAEDATIKLQGQSTELKTAFAGEKVTVTAAGKENAEFTGWTAEGITLTDEQKANPTVTFTMPGNNVTLTPNYNVVLDYGIEVGSENTTPTRVTSKNYKDILNKGVLSYDPTTQTLKSNGKLPRSLQKINAPGKDINLDGKDQIAVAAKLIVVDAHNVTISSNKFAAIFARDDTSTIDCTGKVDIRSGGDVVVNGNLSINNLGDVDLYANGNSISNKALTITSGGNVTIESTDGRAAKNLTINKAEDVTISISDDERAVSENTKITASGTVILENKAPGGPVGTVDFTQADGKKYVYYTSEEPDAELIDPRIHPLPDTVESSYLRIEPRETYYSITVANGTAQVGDDTTGQITTAFEGETVTVKANAPTDEDAAKGVKFHHWKVEEGSTAFTLTDGKLGSKEEAGTEEISFDMPKGDVKLTAVYSIPASVLRSTVTVEGGTAKSTLGEGSDIPAEIGTEVKITATPYDAEKYPGMEFVEWEIKYPDSFYEKFPGGIPENLQLKLDNAKSATTTFKMPVYPVKLIAHWSASPVAKPDPDEPIDEDFGVEPAPMDTTGGTIAAVAVGGAAIWGGYEIATRVILNGLLPEGAAIPANRGQLALLVWNTAGRPEPAGAPAFADVADPDMAKAAQWCTEQGTMDAKGDRFEPEGWTPKFKVIEVWNKAFPKQ